MHVFDWPSDMLHLGALPQKVTRARVLPAGAEVSFTQSRRGLDLTVPAALRDLPITVIELTLDQPALRDQQVGPTTNP